MKLLSLGGLCDSAVVPRRAGLRRTAKDAEIAEKTITYKEILLKKQEND
jgi:hypothetical protein